MSLLDMAIQHRAWRRLGEIGTQFQHDSSTKPSSTNEQKQSKIMSSQHTRTNLGLSLNDYYLTRYRIPSIAILIRFSVSGSSGFFKNPESINVRFEVSPSDQGMPKVKKMLEDQLKKVSHTQCSRTSLSVEGTLNDFPDNNIEFLVIYEEVS